MSTLLSAKQKKEESIKAFVERFRSMTLRCPSGMTQSTLVDICHHNMQTALLAQIGVAKCRAWKQLVLQGEQAKEIVAWVRAEEKDRKPGPTNRHGAPQSHLLNQGEEILWQRRSSYR